MMSIRRSERIRTLVTLIAVILAIPISLKGLTGFLTWMSPYIMLNSVLTLRSFVWLNTFAVSVLVIVAFRKRWFCRYLCPVGWGCDMVSGLNRVRKFSYSRLPAFDIWIAMISLGASVLGFPLLIILDPLAIFNGFFTVISGSHNTVQLLYLGILPLIFLISYLMPGIWCGKLCPLGGLQLVAYDLRSWLARLIKPGQYNDVQEDPARRYFIMTGAGLVAGALIPKQLKPSSPVIIRPPAAAEPSLFRTLCSRCGSCIKACPTKIIIPHPGNGDIIALMTPEIIFTDGYCLETCNLCSRVCPTGAITLFSVEAKSRIFMGLAKITLDKCLLLNNRECIKCRESCKFEAIEFVSKENILKAVPVVVPVKCVGCGACKVICPTGCIEILPVPYS
jgi:ferredoxin-type protein NapF